MSNYKRRYREGGAYFFTLVTHRRRRLFTNPTARSFLHESIEWVRQRHPFEIIAMVLLPDHLHALWRLPEDDQNYSLRWSMIKRRFTMQWKTTGRPLPTQSTAAQRQRRQTLWQPRFWEHLIRDQDDMHNHFNYLHYNPVKHGAARCPHGWPYSTFHRYVQAGNYRSDWYCSCRRTSDMKPPGDLPTVGE